MYFAPEGSIIAHGSSGFVYAGKNITPTEKKRIDRKYDKEKSLRAFRWMGAEKFFIDDKMGFCFAGA